MMVAGVMSGTSADGINVALAELRGRRSPAKGTDFTLHGHAEYRYPVRVRSEVLRAMNAGQACVADLARLNFLLAELYAEAVRTTQRKFHVKLDLVGCHGQTLYHQGEQARFLGRKVATTWQIGEGAVLAARLGVPVVSDFRPADMAAGGKGAPLVPLLDYFLFRHERMGRVVQNIGGIANLTAIPARAASGDVVAFDTGPGNMVIDAVTERLFGQPYDRDGSIAARGRVIEGVLHEVLRSRFFRRPPPKTAGREEFGREFSAGFLRRCGRARKEDIVATATAVTARSIADACSRFVLRKRGHLEELIVSGGGVKNPTLLAMLADEVRPLGLRVSTSDQFGLPSEAKEAAAFALLAYETWHQRPSNVPTATGAKRPAILGKISYA